MGIETSVVTVFGVKYSEQSPEAQQLLDQLIKKGELSDISPIFDTERQGVVGIILDREYYGEIKLDINKIQEEYQKLKKEFYDMTGLEGEYYCSIFMT